MITLVIIAKNAQNTISKSITSAASLVDETIVVLDESSSDETENLLKELNVKTLHRKFDNFSNQKNFGNKHSKNDWIFSLDADEYLSDELINEVKELKLFQTDIVGYSLPRLNYFFGKKVLHSNWGPEDDRHIRLFNKKYGMWTGDVHESILINGKVKKCKYYLIHHPYNSVDEFIEKMNLYTSSEKQFTNPVVDFIRRYFLHSGFKDGLIGLFLCYLMMIYHTTTGIKLWLKNHTSN